MAWLLGQQLQQHILDIAAPPPATPTAILVKWIAATPIATVEVPVKSPVTSRSPVRIGPVVPTVALVWELLVGQAALCTGPGHPLPFAPPAGVRPSFVSSAKHIDLL